MKITRTYEVTEQMEVEASQAADRLLEISRKRLWHPADFVDLVSDTITQRIGAGVVDWVEEGS